jgi:hypothetical protein
MSWPNKLKFLFPVISFSLFLLETDGFPRDVNLEEESVVTVYITVQRSG